MDFWTAFILGLVGSVHCAGMCGPLALALPGRNSPRTHFSFGWLAHNSGRIVTYCLLGLLFGAIGKSLFIAGVQRWLSIALGLALLVGLRSSKKLAISLSVATLAGKLKSRMSSLLRSDSVGSIA